MSINEIMDYVLETPQNINPMILEQKIKEFGKEVEDSAGSSDEGWIGDGNTHIWITLHEGRTSPMLGCCPNGTVTVDWGDGTEPDTLTGTDISEVVWTPIHNYAEPGDYVITLTVDGEMGFYGSNSYNHHSGILRYTSGGDERNAAYQGTVQKIEIGDSMTSISDYAFQGCQSLGSVKIPDSVTFIDDSAFNSCRSLVSITIPNGVTSIGNSTFSGCYRLGSVNIPDGVTFIGQYTFSNCSFTSIAIPDSVTRIEEGAFQYCRGLRFLDFTECTDVPTLHKYGLLHIPADCQMLIPAALYDEWSAEEIWSDLVDRMVAV